MLEYENFEPTDSDAKGACAYDPASPGDFNCLPGWVAEPVHMSACALRGICVSMVGRTSID